MNITEAVVLFVFGGVVTFGVSWGATKGRLEALGTRMTKFEQDEIKNDLSKRVTTAESDIKHLQNGHKELQERLKETEDRLRQDIHASESRIIQNIDRLAGGTR